MWHLPPTAYVAPGRARIATAEVAKLPTTRTLAVALVTVLATGIVALALQRQERRDRLRVIVQQQCVPHWLMTHRAAPCSSVTLPAAGAVDRGYAVLHDRKGGAHFLLIPTRTVRGLESPEARGNDAPNYFAAAWDSRPVLTALVGHGVPRTAVGLAVNPVYARSQDQFHIHLSCLRPAVATALTREAAQLSSRWSTMTLEGHSYQALRVMGEELGDANPIRLLARGVPGAESALEEYTLLIAGAQLPGGPGFIVLAGRRVPGAELLLDPSCALAPDAAAIPP